MKKLKLFAMIVAASLVSVSFNSCGDDDDDVNNYDAFDSCTWDDLANKASFLSAYPKLDGKFSDASILLDQKYGEGQKADMVSFTYELSQDKLEFYIPKLGDNKFCSQHYGDYFLAYKVENGLEYTMQYSSGLFTVMAIKFLNNSDYEEALKDYEENLENMTPTNATWADVADEIEWLKNLPAPDCRFTNYRIVDDNEVALTGSFSLVSRETYAQKLEAAGFVEQPNTSRTMFKKDVDGGGYYFVTMNDVMIDFRDFTNTDNDAIVVEDWE